MIASWPQLLWTNLADGTANHTTSVETGLLVGLNDQPLFEAFSFANRALSTGRRFKVTAQGVLSNTGTPTLIFQLRLGSTAGPTQYGGSSLGVSAAITTASGVTSKYWRLEWEGVVRTPGIGTGNATIAGAGFVTSPSGFGTPFLYPLEPTTPDTATWTQTFDGGLTQYLNLSCVWSAPSASNTITLKDLAVLLLN